VVDINKNMAWRFFDGHCQGHNCICGMGFILFLSNAHFVTGKKKIEIRIE
jgi:hypothetical protein